MDFALDQEHLELDSPEVRAQGVRAPRAAERGILGKAVVEGQVVRVLQQVGNQDQPLRRVGVGSARQQRDRDRLDILHERRTRRLQSVEQVLEQPFQRLPVALPEALPDEGRGRDQLVRGVGVARVADGQQRRQRVAPDGLGDRLGFVGHDHLVGLARRHQVVESSEDVRPAHRADAVGGVHQDGGDAARPRLRTHRLGVARHRLGPQHEHRHDSRSDQDENGDAQKRPRVPS